MLFQHEKDCNHPLLTEEINPTVSVTSVMLVCGTCQLDLRGEVLDCVCSLVFYFVQLLVCFP